MNAQPPSNLNQLQQRLADDAQRVTRFVESLPVEIEQLQHAAKREDWRAVVEQIEALATDGQACNLLEITTAARAVQMAIETNHQLLMQRAVSHLAARCSSAKLPTQEPRIKHR